MLSTAETKCAKWRRESVPVESIEKGREALASCLTDLVFGVVVSIAGCFRGRRVTGSVKFCKAVLEHQDSGMVPGHYLPLGFWKRLAVDQDQRIRGPKGRGKNTASNLP